MRRPGLQLIPFERVEEAVRGCRPVLRCLGSLPEPVLDASRVRGGGVNLGGVETDPALLPTMDRLVADSSSAPQGWRSRT